MILRIIVNMFDPIGVIIPAVLLSAFVFKGRLFWLWTGIVVSLWKGLLPYMADPSLPITNFFFFGLAGLLGGAAWALLYRGFKKPPLKKP